MIPKPIRKRLIFAGALAAVLALSLLLLASRSGSDLPAAPKAASPKVAGGAFQPVTVLTGSLMALRSEEFKVPITETWRVQIKWMVKEGESVKPGDPVVRFDTSGLASLLESAQESLKAKREERVRKQAEFENQKFELDVEVKKARNDNRQKALDASIPEGLESKYEYDRKQLEKKISDEALAGALTNQSVKTADMESQMRTLEIEAGELEANLAKLEKSLRGLTLIAGTEGAVLYDVDEWSGRKVQVGDTVFATSVVAAIPDMTSLIVQAWVSETHVQRVRVGQAVDIYLDAYPDKHYGGAIRQISKSADPVRRWGRSNYFRVEVELETIEPEIMKPGMSVRCEARGPRETNVLLVPLEMAAFDGTSFWVRPAGGTLLKLAAIDYDEFTVAARAADNPRLKAGMTLAGAGPLPRPVEGTKSGETK
jgi:multidrug efflux pump subunit AcrA (membrane-fusion protein)